MTTVSGKEEAGEDASSGSAGCLGIRHLQAFILFCGITFAYGLRIAMSVAVMAMANATTANPDIRDYGWDASERSTILSSFFWGYTITQVPSGYISNIWSAQKLLSMGVFFCGVLNLLTPLAADYGNIIGVCACRVGMGLCQGCLLPSTHTLLSKWVPPSERARLGTFIYAGAQFGTVVAFPISGALSVSAGGWPYIFYVFGVLAAIWGIIFFIFGADAPSSHSSITARERQYIEDSFRIAESTEAVDEKTNLRIPWKEIFTSLPMWSLIIAHCGQNWGYWTLLTEMPTYMNTVLGLNLNESGILSSLPYLTMWILSFLMSWLSDYALQKGVTKAVARKVCNTIAHWGPAIALVCLGFLPTHDSTPAVIILVIAVGLNAGSLCGFQINHIDLSPNFAGTMMSITNCSASVIAIIAPLICGEITTEETNADQWSIVFFVSAVIYFIGNLIFIVFGKAEIQWWNDPTAVNLKQGRHKTSAIVTIPMSTL